MKKKARFRKKTGVPKMAKARRKSRRSGSRMLFKRASVAGKGGLAQAGKYVIAGIVYSAASMLSNYVPVGLDARLKRLIVLGLMWLMGGVFRHAAYVGLAIETIAFVQPYISQMAGGLTQTVGASSNGGF